MSSAAEMMRRAIAGTQEPEPPQWFDLAIELDRQHKASEAERQARRKADEEAQNAPQTTAGILYAAIAGSSAPLPLNGAGILRAALGGGGGTINGEIA
jgi:hypothetical protein